MVLALLVSGMVGRDAAHASPWLVGADAGAWFPSFSGTVYGGTATTAGMSIDLDRELGIEENAVAPTGRIVLRPLANHRFVVDYASASLSGSRTLAQAVTYQDRTYAAASTTTSRIDLDMGGLDYRYSAWRLGGVELAFGVGGRILSVRTRISDPAAGPVDARITIPVPVLVGDARVAMTDRLSGEAELAGFSIDLGGDRASFVDARALLRYELAETFGLAIGWRHVGMELSADGDGADFSLSGPLALVSASF